MWQKKGGGGGGGNHEYLYNVYMLSQAENSTVSNSLKPGFNIQQQILRTSEM